MEMPGLRDEYFDDSKDIYGAGFKIVNIPLRDKSYFNKTIYTLYGDWSGWGCVFISALCVIYEIL